MAVKSFTKYKTCRSCGSKKVVKTVDLGKMPLAGGFIKTKSDFKYEKKYPLDLLFCKECFLLQTSVSINPDILFKNYFYFSSTIKTLIEHFNKIAVSAKKLLPKNSFVVEVGCNDGEFLKALKKQKIKALGVDPATNVVKPLIKQGLPIINSYFNISIANKIIKKYGQSDAIYSFHSMAHIPDMHEVIKGIKILLKPNGYLAFEVHYLASLLENMQYDMIYHEHLHYYSVLSVENLFNKYEMELFNVELNDQRGGSIIFYLQNKQTGKRKISGKVQELRKKELRKKLNTPLPYINFDIKIIRTKNDLNKIIGNLKEKNKKIAGYGASGRGTVIMNYCGLKTNILDFVVDDAPAKQGSYMPGTHNPIFPSIELFNKKIDYAVVFAWPFIEEVKKRNSKYLKNGGKFIVPLPKVRVINGK